MKSTSFDIIVVGAGHAGCEAAWVSAGMGYATALITLDPAKAAAMSCNPAFGGIGKGQLIKEIDSLGGLMAEVIDHTGIHYRLLNTKKGPAVQAPRAQADSRGYPEFMYNKLKTNPNLSMITGEVTSLKTDGGKISGVVINKEQELSAGAVILTTGTFLGGLIHIGMKSYPGGRAEDPAAYDLSESLRNLGFNLLRLKTGTPARLNCKTIDYSNLEKQDGDEPSGKFSFRDTPVIKNKITCHITRTTKETHDIIRNNLDESPLYGGVITGVGPRYCPSIEDKVMRFPNRESHQIFLEPEGLDTDWVYPNGISTSLPEHVQDKYIRSIPGLENVDIFRYGYAIEYDYINPTELYPWLETKTIKNLYFAGQINGTTGYEEAGAQGIMAGINAALKLKGEPPFVLERSDAYIGVLIDDLVTKGIQEPYRLFSSRVEYRLILRCDNADFRLMEHGYKFGLVPEHSYVKLKDDKKIIDEKIETLSNTVIKPSTEVNKILAEVEAGELRIPAPLAAILKRPGMTLNHLAGLGFDLSGLNERVFEQVEINVKYEGYIKRQKTVIEKLKKWENLKIPADIDYKELNGLKTEAKEKLMKLKPLSLGQASRITGISSMDLAILQFYIEKGHKQ